MNLRDFKLWLGVTSMGATFIATFEGLQSVLPHIQGQLSLTANITLATVDMLIPSGAAILLGKGVLWVHSSWQRNKLLTSDQKHAVILQGQRVINVAAETAMYETLGRVNATAQRQLTAPRSKVEQQDAPPLSLPQRTVPFSAMQHYITEQQEVLGWDGAQWITASPEYTLSVGVIGKPGSGKTSLDRYFTAMALKRKAEISGWDMHGDIVRELGSAFRILDDPRDILADAEWIISEIERRTTLYKQVYKDRNPSAQEQWDTLPELFHMIDEFTALMTALKRNKPGRALCQDALLRLITEGRKLKMRTVISGQSLPAEIFGGSGARDNLQTRYAFGAEPEQARMLGVPESAISELLPLVGGDDSKGYAVLCGGPLRRAVIVSVPYTTVEDISALLSSAPMLCDTEPLPELHMSKQPVQSLEWNEPVLEVTASFEEWWDLCVVREVGADTASWQCYHDYWQRCTSASVEPMQSGEFTKLLKRTALSSGCKENNNSGLKLDGSRGQRSGWTGLSLKSA